MAARRYQRRSFIYLYVVASRCIPIAMSFDFRLELNVPFHEKDEAKLLGAKWNPKEKIWYIDLCFEDLGTLNDCARWDPRIYLHVPFQDKDAAKG